MTSTLQWLDPTEILAEDNSRFGLKKIRVARLAEDILAAGGVQVPVEVEAMEADEAGHTHRLISGFYRHAAVTKLNEQGAGLKLPVFLRDVEGSARIKTQVRENVEREGLSPMDEAVTIRRLLDSGVPRSEIAKTFARPSGRKGLVMQPASNAFLNMTMSFLDLPKAIQEKIHDGRVGVAAAYELTKVPPDKRQLVLDRAEKDRQALLDREEREEAKYVTAETKAQAAQTKAQELAALADQTAAELAEAQVWAKTCKTALRDAKGLVKHATSDEEMDLAHEHIKAAETDLKGAEKLVESKQKALGKVKGRAADAEETAEEAAERLGAATSGKKAKAIGAAEVKAAAQQEGAQGSGSTALSAKQMRGVVSDLALGGSYPKVQEIGVLFLKCFDGILTDDQLYSALAVVTGERVAKGKKAKAQKGQHDDAE